MLKVVWILTFRPDVDRDEVIEWWRTEHGKRVLAVPGVKRYVQNVYVPSSDEVEGADAGLEFDAVAEWWFDDEAAFDAAVASPEWASVVADTERGFDLAVAQGGFSREHIMRWDGQYDGRIYLASGHVPD